MSRLSVVLLAVGALLAGLIAGCLIVMFVVVMPTSEESEFAKSLRFESILQASSPQGTSWHVIDNGNRVYGIGSRRSVSRRYIAEATLQPAERGNLTNALQTQLTVAMRPEHGLIYGTSSGSTATSGTMATPSGVSTPLPRGADSFLTYQTFTYTSRSRQGMIHVFYVGDGEKVRVIMVLTEN